MRRGTRVGQAYVALAVDGSNVNEEIVEAFDNVDYKGLGERHGKQYAKNLQKHMEKDLSKAAKNSMQNLAKAIETDEKMRKSVKRMVKMVERDDSINTLYRHIAKEAGVEFEGEFEKTIKNTVRKGLDRSFRNAARSGGAKDLLRSLVSSVGIGDGKGSMLLPGVDVEGMAADLRRELEKAGNEWKSMLDDAHKMNQRFNENRRKEQEETLQRMLATQKRLLAEEAKAKAEADLEAARSDKERFDARKRLIAETLRYAEARAREEEKILNRISALSKKFTERDGEARKKIEREVALAAKLTGLEREEAYKRIHETAEKYYTDLTAWRKEQERLSKEAIRAARDEERVSGNRGRGRGRDRDPLAGAAIGAFFGAGARNNALNLLGRTIGRTLTTISASMTGTTKVIGIFSQGMAKAGEEAGKFARVLSGVGAVGSALASSVAAALPALIIAIPVVLTMMSALVSAITALLGMVTALAGALTAGLSAALVVTSGAIAAVVAGAGLLTAAFMSMDDAQKKILKDSFRPLKEGFVGLGQIMLQDLVPAFKTWSENLQQALALLIPAAQVMGQAFADAGNILTAAFSGPGFQRFADAMAIYLPSITTNLSRALGNFLNGLTGVFAALMPYVQRFAVYLADVTKRFSEWATSADGQNSIVNWAERALTSLKSVWNFVRELSGLLIDVLFNDTTQDTGQGFFDSMADSLRRFRDAVADGALEKWLQDAKNFASDLKEMVIGLKDALTDLYDSGVLQSLGSALSFLGDALSFVGEIIGPVVSFIGREAVTQFETLSAVADHLSVALDWVAGALQRVLGWLDGLTSTSGYIPMVSEIGKLVDALQMVIDKANETGNVLGTVFGAVVKAVPGLNTLSSGYDLYKGLTSGSRGSNSSSSSSSSSSTSSGPGFGSGLRLGVSASRAVAPSRVPSLGSVIRMGQQAISRTTPGGGGGGGGGGGQTINNINNAAPKYVNPYKAWAESLIKDGPGIAAQIRKALRKMEKDASKAIMDASKATDASSVRSSLKAMAKGMRDEGKSLVEAAQNALNSAARSLANASSPEDAARALKEVKKAQRGLQQALKAQKNLQKTAKTIASQRVVTSSNVKKLMQGLNVRSATLADYARAQERIAKRLEKANERLANAVAMRDDYRNAVTDSIKQFGSLLSAEASVVDGIEQALTHQDITGNLQDRLTQIKNFQDNLRILLSRGLSDAAYKQIVDGGVEQGGAIAEALVAGGVGAVDQTNQLVGKINGIANSLGLETSNHLYQAGVDVAQGLVDGLNSLSKDLEFAANQLGVKIANSLRRSLGIKSPSTVMIAAMSDVGDGIVAGLDNQHNKVIGASSSLAGAIAVSPEVAMWEARMRANGGVSGNSRTVGDITVITPTEDPAAVAHEVVNEIVGRL